MSFILEDEDGNIVRISFIRYTRACCGTQHEKEKSYGTYVKDVMQRYLEEESARVKKYLDSIKATYVVADVEKIHRRICCFFSYKDFVISVPPEQRYLIIRRFPTKWVITVHSSG